VKGTGNKNEKLAVLIITLKYEASHWNYLSTSKFKQLICKLPQANFPLKSCSL
jgi:hypothetical protein